MAYPAVFKEVAQIFDSPLQEGLPKAVATITKVMVNGLLKALLSRPEKCPLHQITSDIDRLL